MQTNKFFMMAPKSFHEFLNEYYEGIDEMTKSFNNKQEDFQKILKEYKASIIKSKQEKKLDNNIANV